MCDIAKYSDFQRKQGKVFLHRFMSIGKAKKVSYFIINNNSCKQIMEIINDKCNFLEIVGTVLRAGLADNFSMCKLISQSEVSSHLTIHLF